MRLKAHLWIVPLTVLGTLYVLTLCWVLLLLLPYGAAI